MSATELSAYLRRPMSPPGAEVAEAIARGPIEPGDALVPGDVDRMLDPAQMPAETGWCTLPDGVAYAAVRTEMAGVSAEMVDWWFDWHWHDSIRFQLWFPGAHDSTRAEPAGVAAAKPLWGELHYPVEDIGLGMQRLRIEFKRPMELGFSTDALDDPRVATIVAGLVGDNDLQVRHTLMVHVFLNAARGVTLRSRFWIGAVLRPYDPAPDTPTAAAVPDRRIDPARVVPRQAAHAMAKHCAAEYANLASLLPELYMRYAS
jgi:phloretin hydrolase